MGAPTEKKDALGHMYNLEYCLDCGIELLRVKWVLFFFLFSVNSLKHVYAHILPKGERSSEADKLWR